MVAILSAADNRSVGDEGWPSTIKCNGCYLEDASQRISAEGGLLEVKRRDQFWKLSPFYFLYSGKMLNLMNSD